MTTASAKSASIILFATATVSAGSAQTILCAMTISRLARVDVQPNAACGAMLAGKRLSFGRKLRRPALHQRGWPAGLALLLGGLILWLAVPRVLASAWLASRDPVIQQMDAGESVSEPELLGLIASRELALGWVDDREIHDQRGTALAELAFREDLQSAAETATLERAIGATRAGLAVAPAAPKDWMQLAYLLVLLEGDTNPEAAKALLVSIRTGPFQAPEFLGRRLFWCLAHWTFYDAEEQRQVGDQIRLAWRVAPGELADIALYVPEFAAPIASALETASGAREQFIAALAFATPLSTVRSGAATP
jgi:hypothetical protein